jgi:hypothetical protein
VDAFKAARKATAMSRKYEARAEMALARAGRVVAFAEKMARRASAAIKAADLDAPVCDNCHTWYDESDLKDYQGSDVCAKCATELHLVDCSCCGHYVHYLELAEFTEGVFTCQKCYATLTKER